MSRKSENTKASNLRKRVRDGGQLTDTEKAWLDNYEATKRKPGRPPGSVKREITPDDIPDSTVEPDSVPEQSEAPNNWADDLPAPPRIVLNERKASGGDWREKYRNAEGGGKLGREGTCVLVASYWVGFLKTMEDSLRSAGIEPIIETAALAPAIVLTVDELLPDHVEFSPRVVAVGGTSALAIQRFMRRSDVAKAEKKAKERADFDRWREHRKDPPPPTDIASHPDYARASADAAQPDPASPEKSAPVAPSEPKQDPRVVAPARQAIQAASSSDPIDKDGVW